MHWFWTVLPLSLRCRVCREHCKSELLLSLRCRCFDVTTGSLTCECREHLFIAWFLSCCVFLIHLLISFRTKNHGCDYFCFSMLRCRGRIPIVDVLSMCFAREQWSKHNYLSNIAPRQWQNTGSVFVCTRHSGRTFAIAFLCCPIWIASTAMRLRHDVGTCLNKGFGDRVVC